MFPLYILAPFVKDKVPILVWVSLWAFYLAPFVYISVLVPVPPCLDDCSFLVYFEVRKVDFSSSVFLSQDCFHFSLSCIGEGNGSPLPCSSLENPRDGGAWWAAVYGVTHSWT